LVKTSDISRRVQDSSKKAAGVAKMSQNVSGPSLELFYEYLDSKCTMYGVYLVFEAVVELRQLM